jgi:hypothetical protein
MKSPRQLIPLLALTAVCVHGGRASASPPSRGQYPTGSAPIVSGISPPVGPLAGGTLVTITGSGFTGASVVAFGPAPAPEFTIVSDAQITATSPAGSGTVNVTVITPDGTSTAGSSAQEYTYEPLPAVTGISPAAGPSAGGSVVTISGTGFTGASTVQFGSTAAQSVTVLTDAMLTALSPAGVAGTVDVTVTTPDGASATDVVDRFTYVPPPAISALSPDKGPLGGGTEVTITGSDLTGTTTVLFGAKPATSFDVTSPSQITALSPPASAGPVDVQVVTPGGTSDVTPPYAIAPPVTFTYANAPMTAPTVTVHAASGAQPTSITLHATVDPNGLALSGCRFQYGTTKRYGRAVACARSTGGSASSVAVSAVLKGLVPATRYHYQLSVTTAAGTGRGPDETFTTPALQAVVAPFVGLLLEPVTGRPGIIGELLGVQGISGAIRGESIILRCINACSDTAVLDIPLRGADVKSRKFTLASPLLLAAATRIEIDISASGKLGRYARYAFALARRSVAVRIIVSGCLSPAAKVVKC